MRLRSSSESERTVTGRVRLRGRRGFTLMEAVVSLLLLVVVMVIAMSLLFTMRSFAERQSFVTAPRQTARRALSYLSYYLASAGDLNRPTQATLGFSPNALIMYYNRDESTTAATTGRSSQVQASYDNLTAAQAAAGFGDEGTDLITIAVPVSPVTIPLTDGVPGGDKRAAPLWFRFSKFCSSGGNAAMYAEFQRLTGAGTAPYLIPFPGSGGGAASPNPLMILFDDSGNWVYWKVDTYNNAWGNCASPQSQFAGAQLSVGVSGLPDPPGGNRLAAFNNAVQLAAGLQFITFRVRNHVLEQRFGLFDPLIPNPTAPDAVFSPVVENVDDLQIAYLYPDGTIANNAANPIATGAAPFSGVPSQVGPCGGSGITTCDPNPNAINCPCSPVSNLDVQNVIALRVSVTARSLPLPEVSLNIQNAQKGSVLRWYGPDSEDHVYAPTPTPPSPVVYYQYYRATTTLMLRNRTLTEGAPINP